MTAACDVAFLLLIFFVLSAKPKSVEPANINLPGASSNIFSDQSNKVAFIIIGNGKVFFEIPDALTRKKTLAQMSAKYRIPFTTIETSKFAGIEIIGVPVTELKRYIDGYNNQIDFSDEAGIPLSEKNHELANWIYESKKAYNSLYDKKLDFAIKADEAVKYPQIKSVMDVLQRQGIIKFSLMTNLKNPVR